MPSGGRTYPKSALASLPVVMLVATEFHAEHLRSTGIDAHCCLVKPVRVPSLIEMIARIDTLGVTLMAEGDEEAA